MKKNILSILAIAAAAAVSCNKDVKPAAPETTVPAGSTPCTIKASVDASTKTTYADGKTFSWVSGDAIAVQYFSTGESEDGFAVFTTEDTAPVADFSGVIPDDAQLEAEGYAVYPASLNPHLLPDLAPLIAVDLPTVYDIRGLADPLSILPMVAKNDGNGNYAFQHATGILKINLTGIPEEAATLRLVGNGQALGGEFIINLAYYDKPELDRMIAGDYYASGSRTIRMQFDRPENGEATLYVPVPVGTLTAGLSIDLLDATGAAVFSKATKKDIPVARKQVVELPSINCDVWRMLGRGMFVDHFYGIPGVNVSIEQNTENPAQYRVVNPYGSLLSSVGYVAPQEVTGPDSYLNLELLEQGSDYNELTVEESGRVGFDEHYTGYVDNYYNVEVILAPGYLFANAVYNDIRFSRVLKYAPDGEPTHIQLAPAYYYEGIGAYKSDLYMNNNIQIAMPGYELLDLDAYIASVRVAPESTAAAPVIEAEVYIGADLVGRVGIGASQQEAENAARAAGPSQSGVVKFNLPANAPSGKYFVSLTTYLEGESEAWILAAGSVVYTNPDETPLTVDDILGTYTATAFDLINETDVTFTFSIVASDDPNYDVMITGGFGGFTFTSGYSLYGTFDPAAREITWDDASPVYYDSSQSRIGCLEDYDGPPYPIVFTVLAPGVVTTDQWIVVSYYNTSWQLQGYAAGWSDFSAERSSAMPASVAPAAAPASAGAPSGKISLPSKPAATGSGVLRAARRPLGRELEKAR